MNWRRDSDQHVAFFVVEFLELRFVYFRAVFLIWYLASFASKTSDIFSNRLLRFSLRIVKKNDYEKLLLLSKIVFEAIQSKRTFISDISTSITYCSTIKAFSFYVNDQKIQEYHIENHSELFELRNFSITHILRFQDFLQRLQTLNYIYEKYNQWRLFSFHFEDIYAICNRYFFFFQNLNQQRSFILFVNFHARCLENLTISCKNFSDSWISITNSSMRIWRLRSTYCNFESCSLKRSKTELTTIRKFRRWLTKKKCHWKWQKKIQEDYLR